MFTIWMETLKKKIDAFSAESETLSALNASIFHSFFSALKVKRFQPNFSLFFSPTVKMQQNPNLGRKR
jgi:hypothetical protein